MARKLNESSRTATVPDAAVFEFETRYVYNQTFLKIYNRPHAHRFLHVFLFTNRTRILNLSSSRHRALSGSGMYY